MSKGKNVVVLMGGGPTVVINNSLRAIVEACSAYSERFGTVYGAWHGVEGLLREELLNLSAQPKEEIALLRTTPAAGAIGTTRYRLVHEEDLRRIIEVLKAHKIGYFFGIGGNDTQEVCLKVAEAAAAANYELIVVGVPKTIDNDLGDPELRLVDHTPGYGSVARYWAWTLQCLEEENRGSAPADPVLVVQAMGRRIGFIPAASRLADPEREFPLLILFAEAPLPLEEVADHVADLVRRKGRAIVVVSEGFPVGELGARTDSFGHAAFSSAKLSAAQVLATYLNEKGLPSRGLARWQVPGTEQRDAILYTSPVDLKEAYAVGCVAVELAVKGISRVMVTIRRAEESVYRPEFGTVALSEVAGKDRPFPRGWIASSQVDVTDEFIRYARPLLGEDLVSVPIVDGRLRFARLKPIFAEKLLPSYTPAAYRGRR
ncbi:MAG: diphosphate--fructose-6-phosphate 1-phosphotransferase [Methanomassiliicoccales archaeon]|nr:diphosphate--fructose-6-phosphate 1-phosphotransferase [Methanomassiliicoccales archaeon]